MKLYKNVDIKDLDSILTQGILPISITGNNNWEDNKRSKNSTDVVYLFEAARAGDSFVNYGLALIEVEVDAMPNNITENDINYGNYIEYIVNEVTPEQIVNVYVPNFININNTIITKVDYVCNYWSKNGFTNLDGDARILFEDTVKTSTYDFNYLRGKNADRTMIDVEKKWFYELS